MATDTVSSNVETEVVLIALNDKSHSYDAFDCELNLLALIILISNNSRPRSSSG